MSIDDARIMSNASFRQAYGLGDDSRITVGTLDEHSRCRAGLDIIESDYVFLGG
jgi:hypothetical protein